MDMNKTFFLAKEARNPRWHIIDASDKVLGRFVYAGCDLVAW